MHTLPILIAKLRPAFAFCLILFMSTQSIVSAQDSGDESTLSVLDRQGVVSVQRNDKMVELKENEIPHATERIMIGKAITFQEVDSNPEALSQAFLVLSLSSQDLIRISNGTIFQRKISKTGETPEYHINGVGHLLFKKSDQPYQINVNGLLIQTNGISIFYNSLKGVKSLAILEGSAAFVLVGAEGKSQEGVIEVGDRLIISESGFHIEKDYSHKEDKYYLASIVPGFSKLGSYEQIGKMEVKDKQTTITRYGQSFKVSRSPVAIMKGDLVTSGENESALLRLKSKDAFRLYPKSEFGVTQYSSRERTLDVKTVGKIRARISKRVAPGKIRFRTSAAMISVKGTDFQLLSSAGGTEVATVEGVVGLSDPLGKGEIEIPNGMKSSVADGEFPKPAEPIPADELQELYDSGLPIDPQSVIKLNDVVIQSPQSEQTYFNLKLTYQADPVDATLLFTIDGKKAILSNDSDLSYLPSGKHEMVVKGFGEDAISKTVTFYMDKTLPSIQEDPVKQDSIKEGDLLRVSWTKALSAVSVKYGETELPATILEESPTVIEVETSPLFLGDLQPSVSLSFEATDRIENKVVVNKTYSITPKPENLPLLTLEDGTGFTVINASDDVKIVADRKIRAWRLFIDEKPVILPGIVGEEAGNEDPVSLGRLLILQSQILAQYPPGEHRVRLEADDEFGMMGRIDKVVLFDYTAPILMEPVGLLNPISVQGETRKLTLGNLRIKEGEGIQFNSSEPLSEFTVTFVELSKRVDLMVSDHTVVSKNEIEGVDKTHFILRADQLKEALQTSSKSMVRFEYSDIAGNKAEADGLLTVYPKLPGNPELAFENGLKSILVTETGRVVIQADRYIAVWDLLINGQRFDLPIKPGEPNQSIIEDQRLLIPATLFSAIKDGEYPFSVIGTDGFNRKNQTNVILKIDQSGPVIVAVSRPVNFGDLRIKDNETLTVTWNKKLAKIEATIANKKWDLTALDDEKTMEISLATAKLTTSRQKYTISVTDQKGRVSLLRGFIALEKPKTLSDKAREERLRKAYENSMLINSDDPLDQSLKVIRPGFIFDKAKSDVYLDELYKLADPAYLEGHEIIIKFSPKTNSTFIKSVDESIANIY